MGNPTLLKLDVEDVRSLAQSMIDGVNEFMQDYRVLCVTTHKDSEKMWSGYAEDHKGIALRIQGNGAKDSKFQLFRPVTYREARPTIYRDAVDFLVSSLFADPNGARALNGKQVGNAEAVAKLKATASQRAADLKAIVDDIKRSGITSVRGIAEELHVRGIRAPRGDTWHPTAVSRLLARL
jgi:hypothetical protein